MEGELDLNIVHEALVDMIEQLLGLVGRIRFDQPEIFSLVEATLTLELHF